MIKTLLPYVFADCEKTNANRQVIQCNVNCIMLYYTMYHITIR